MYNQNTTQKLLRLAGKLLAQAGSSGAGGADEQTIADVRQVINFADWRYYIQDDPLLADQEYDKLFSLLKQLEQRRPELITPDSPTQRIAQGLTRAFPTVQHLVPMLSLDNSYNEADLLDWARRNGSLTGSSDIEYCAEPKFDGASISLIYEDDRLVRGATRGNGIAGDDITVNIRQIRSIPLTAPFSRFGIRQAEIRGEVLIHKDAFKTFNEQRLADNLPPLANPRNAASGSLRMVDPREVGKRGLVAFLYHLAFYQPESAAGEEEALKTHYGTLEMLQELGFRTPLKATRKIAGIANVVEWCHRFETQRDDLPYEVDGVVIKVNDYALQEKMGMTTHHPRWAMAFKFKARQATSKLLRIEFQVGRTGSITPVAKIDPVPIGGVTVASVSLFNEDVVREKDLRIGDTVLVERAGDVIPYIVKPLAELRNGSEKEIRFPTHCPVCGDELYKAPGESAWRCVNINCEAQVLERLIHFVSKNAMDIHSLGEANIRRFYSLGLLRDIPGIYRLDFEKIGTLEGFGQRSVDNLKQAVEHSKQQPLHRLIYALGIRYVGETTAKTLAHAVERLPDLEHLSEASLLELEDIGPKVAGSVIEFFSNPDNRHILKQLETLGLNISRDTPRSDPASHQLEGQTFLFTGTLARLKRSEAEAMVEQMGGKILSGVSSKLNYLVVGEDAGSKLEKAKKIASIHILSEDAFLKMAAPGEKTKDTED
ncbi:NAD-dependent DNA ligase LigA [Compostibacter hankyongensis]|uniref:DNA ligase n=1 Tax=Compostibacter hankyongensis TaxID=1007089 RepID=A0ABP8FTH0_9BACT